MSGPPTGLRHVGYQYIWVGNGRWGGPTDTPEQAWDLALREHVRDRLPLPTTVQIQRQALQEDAQGDIASVPESSQAVVLEAGQRPSLDP